MTIHTLILLGVIVGYHRKKLCPKPEWTCYLGRNTWSTSLITEVERLTAYDNSLQNRCCERGSHGIVVVSWIYRSTGRAIEHVPGACFVPQFILLA